MTMVGKNSKGCWGKAERMGRSGLSLQISAAPAPGKIPLSLEAGSVSGAQSQVGIGLLGMLLEDEDLEGSRGGLGRAEGPFGPRSKVLLGEKTPRRLYKVKGSFASAKSSWLPRSQGADGHQHTWAYSGCS